MKDTQAKEVKKVLNRKLNPSGADILNDDSDLLDAATSVKVRHFQAQKELNETGTGYPKTYNKLLELFHLNNIFLHNSLRGFGLRSEPWLVLAGDEGPGIPWLFAPGRSGAWSTASAEQTLYGTSPVPFAPGCAGSSGGGPPISRSNRARPRAWSVCAISKAARLPCSSRCTRSTSVRGSTCAR